MFDQCLTINKDESESESESDQMKTASFLLISAALVLLAASSCHAFTASTFTMQPGCKLQSSSSASASPRRHRGLALRMADLYEDDQDPTSAREYLTCVVPVSSIYGYIHGSEETNRTWISLVLFHLMKSKG
jgi:hypothetical protein